MLCIWEINRWQINLVTEGMSKSSAGTASPVSPRGSTPGLLSVRLVGDFAEMTSRSYFSSQKQIKSNASMLENTSSRDALLYRAAFFLMLITTLMGACVYRLVQLQIVEGSYNRQLADENRIRMIPMPADRGVVTDRKGRLLASNRLSRYVYLWPRHQTPAEWRATADILGPILEMPASEIVARLEQTGYNSALPIRIGQQVTPTAFVALAEQASNLRGVEIVAGSSRQYPHGKLAAHVLGYIGEATEADMQRNPDYPVGMIVGQMGIERLANSQLEGRWGGRLVEVDAGGQEARLLGIKEAVNGSPVQLTLDLELQKAAERALGNRRGAVVAMDVKTGAVLVMASSPAFDPNMFTRRFSQQEWQALQGGAQPFLNRALQGYPPGSTFKIVTAAAGMQTGKFSPNARIGTSAFISVGGIQFWEHSKHGYGSIGFRDALAVSSNTFFYRVGMTVGPEAIAQWGKALGIGTTDSLKLEGLSHGVLPIPAEKEAWYGEPWYLGDTVSMGIGQGLVQATPLELAVMVAAIANGGQRVHPHLLTSETAKPEMQPEPTGLNPATVATIQSGLVEVVTKGTGRRLNDGSIPLTAGKTGTAEVGPGRAPNAMYVGYGPVNDPQIAIAVVVENGGYGGVAAIPIAHEVYKVFFGAQK